MTVERLHDLISSNPQASARRIHHLNEIADDRPQDDEMGIAVRMSQDGDGWQRVCFRQQNVVGWDHELTGVQAGVVRKPSQVIERCAIQVRSAGLA